MKLHASLSEPPDLSHYFGGDWDLGYLGRVRMCPSLDHVRAGRADADAGRLPHHPSMIMQIPSVYDPSMAPEGKHCMSVWVETAAFELADGSWDDAREQVADIIVDALSVYAPNIKDAIIDRQVVTPLDLVREVGLTNGDILHLDMTPQQFFASRPLRGWNSYRTPIANYYLCGAGTHPGGYVSGAPGHNAGSCHPPRHGARFLTTPHHPSDPESFHRRVHPPQPQHLLHGPRPALLRDPSHDHGRRRHEGHGRRFRGHGHPRRRPDGRPRPLRQKMGRREGRRHCSFYHPSTPAPRLRPAPYRLFTCRSPRRRNRQPASNLPSNGPTTSSSTAKRPPGYSSPPTVTAMASYM